MNMSISIKQYNTRDKPILKLWDSVRICQLNMRIHIKFVKKKQFLISCGFVAYPGIIYILSNIFLGALVSMFLVFPRVKIFCDKFTLKYGPSP